jgi:hypothetical protein
MKTLLPAAALGCLLSSRIALATLGGDVSSVESDRIHMKAAAVTSTASALYTVHEMQTPDGTTIREFANASGTVFAVTWKGPFPPDLRQTLGSYFQKYQTAPRAKRSGHSHDSVEQPDLVVHSGGHLRAFVGSAYVPQLVPAGVSIDQLLQSPQ